MSNELPENFKLVVPQGKSEEIQKKLFSLGCEWRAGGQSIMLTTKPYLIITKKKIEFLIESESFYDNKPEHTEITFKQLMDMDFAPKKTDKEKLSEEEESKRKKMVDDAIEMINKGNPFVIIGEINEKSNRGIQCGLTNVECIKAMKTFILNASNGSRAIQIQKELCAIILKNILD